jgi:hypothetical protein
LDSLRDKIWRNLLDKEIQLKYESAMPDAFPMPKRHYLHPVFDVETWDALVKAYVESLDTLRDQAVKEAAIPKKREPPWLTKNSSSGFFEYHYPEDKVAQPPILEAEDDRGRMDPAGPSVRTGTPKQSNPSQSAPGLRVQPDAALQD